MKKRLLAGIMTAVLGVLAVAPVTGFADVNTKADVNNDGQVNLADYSLLRKAVEKKAQIENGKLLYRDVNGQRIYFVRGDIDQDGVLGQSDLDWLKQYGQANIDSDLADVNCDGTIDLADYSTLRKAVCNKGQVNSDGRVQFYVTGDLNENGYLDEGDLLELKKLI